MKDTLQWYLEMGVDETIDEVATNRFAQKPPVQTAQPVSNTEKIISNFKSNIDMAKKVQSPSSLALETRKTADACENLEQLEKAVREFKGMSVTKTATNVVFCDGQKDAEIMLIGEAPGADEDANGIPFCGASGKMLDQMLSFIDLSRQKNFYITNTLFWRPPGNRRPTPEELSVCLPFVEKHIALVKPKLIILIGGTAVNSILDSKEAITKLRGKYYDYENRYLESPIKTTVIFHPSYLLRSPGQKQHAWKDCLKLREYIEEEKIAV